MNPKNWAVRRVSTYLLIGFLSTTIGCTQVKNNIVSDKCGLPSDSTRNSIVFITTTAGNTGSGVIIGRDRVLTVAHTIDLDETASVKIDGEYKKAEILLFDGINDLALLSVPTQDLEPIPLSTPPLSADEAVWALGFPLAKSQRLSLGLYKNEYNKRLYSTTHVNSGVSGGGLLRCSGGNFELAGIVHGYVAQVEGDNYINIGDSTSVPADTIQDFMSKQSELVYTFTHKQSKPTSM